MLSPLQLSHYTIDELSVVANPDCSEVGTPSDWTVSVSPRHLVNSENANEHLIILEATVKARRGKKKTLPYYVAIKGTGLFEVDPQVANEEERNRLVHFNGSAILFGLLRAQVAQVTALGLHGVFLLPTVNLLEALDEVTDEEKGENEQ